MKEALPLDKFLLQFAKDRREACKRGEESRTQITVALQRRFRGADLSDRIGRFIRGGTGMWKGDGSEDLSGVDIKCVNIVKPAIRLNQSALSSARVAIRNDPANKDPNLKGAANVADGIVQWLEDSDEHWSGMLESRQAQMVQTGYGCFVRTGHDPNKENDVETQEWEEKSESMAGEYACKCGSGGVFDHEMQENDEPPEQTPCPKCREMAEVTKYPRLALVPRPGEKQSVRFGDNVTRVSSCLEHRVDEKDSQGGNLLQATWFEHHYLVSEDELEVQFPKWELPKAGEWSYSLRWKYALETGNDVFNSAQTNEFTKRRERQDWYVLPEAIAGRVEPEDYELKDGEGNVVISVKKGDRLADKAPFCFSVIGEELAPYWEELDFRDEFVYSSFMPDAHSFWGQPLVELLQIQDDWNTLYTIDIQHRERNSLNQIIYNSQMFDADKWERDLVPTAENFTQGEQPLSHYYAQLQAAPMGEAVGGLKFLFEILPYVGGAPPEAIGVDPPGEDNYSAQLLRKQSTLGQLKPPAESKANAKVRYVRNHMKIAQKNWPEERFQYIRTRFGWEWKDDDIDAFLNCDIERDIVTSFVEGTEIPTDFIQRRVDLENAINKFIEAQSPPPKELLKEYFGLLNLDYDLGGMEADERLAESRYRKMKEGLKTLTGKVSDAPVIDGMTGQPQPSMLIQAVMSHPSFQVKPKEGHQVAIEFYVEKEKALLAEDDPDLNLIGCCDDMIARHEAGGVSETQNQTAQQVAGQAPAIQAQQQMEADNQPPDNSQAQMQADSQQKSAEMAQDAQQASEDRDFEAAKVASDREHELVKMDREYGHQLAIKQMELTHQAKIAKEKPKKAA